MAPRRRGFLRCTARPRPLRRRRACQSTTRRVRPGRRRALRPSAQRRVGGQSPHPYRPPNRTGRGREAWSVGKARRPGRRALGQKASGATCVQRLDGSRDSAIHTKYRISLRSSSMREPRYPLPRVVQVRRTLIASHAAPQKSSPRAPLSRRGCSLARNAPKIIPPARPARRARRRRKGHPRRTAIANRHRCSTSSQSSVRASTMILPQVHLRKPCYDFSFL